MLDPAAALAAAARPWPTPSEPQQSRPRRALVVGGGGTLGAAVLEQLLAGHRFEHVGVLAGAALQPAMRGLLPFADGGAALARYAPDTALIVFDRERHANGRDATFVRPLPADLPARASQLHSVGVRRLIVVVPHAPALLPRALLAGLASLDEAAVAAIGFERLVFMRMAQSAPSLDAGTVTPLARLAAWMLSQLKWVVPQQEQPVRAVTVARVAAALASAGPGADTGTRVLPPQVLWQAALTAGSDGIDALVADWLAGRPLPATPQGAAARQRW